MSKNKRIAIYMYPEFWKKLDALVNEADRLYPGKKHSRGDIIQSLIARSMNSPENKIKDLRTQKKELACQISRLTDEEERLMSLLAEDQRKTLEKELGWES